MLTTLAIANYRSVRQIVLPLGRLNVVTGANGSGKSNLYRALRLLSDPARGGVISTLAREGGFDSTLWAGPAKLTRGMKTGAVRVEGARDARSSSSRSPAAATSVGSGAFRRHASLSAVGRRADDAATAATRGAERAVVRGRRALDEPDWSWPER